MKIFVMGSCRVQSSLRKYKRLYNNSVDLVLFPPLMHTLEEFIQTLNSKKYGIKFGQNVYDLRWGEAEFTQITEKNKFGDYLKIEDADIFVIEVCGCKYHKNNMGLVFHPFPQFYPKEMNYETCYTEHVYEKLERMHKLIDNKPLVLVSNHNVYEKESRRKLILKLESFDRYHENVKLWNPTGLIKEEGIESCLKDVNHFTEKMKKLQAENILRLCKELM